MVQVTTMPVVAQSLGVERVVIGRGIAHPLGDPALSLEQEADVRDTLVKEALDRLLQ